MQKIIVAVLICTHLTGCFSDVINVEQVRSTNTVILAGKQVKMPKPGCYMDLGHGRFCTGREYKIDSSMQWEVVSDGTNSPSEPANKATDHQSPVRENTASEIDYVDDVVVPVAKFIGVVAVFALVAAGVYYGAKAASHSYQPILVTDLISSNSVINSKIDGDFNGWEGQTVVTLLNGQVWQQAKYHYQSHYAYMPEVIIYPDGIEYKMIVKGTDPVSVRRLN